MAVGLLACQGCRGFINIQDDPYCLVVPHGKYYSHRQFVPMCRDCREHEGYDIVINYQAVKETKAMIQGVPTEVREEPSQKLLCGPDDIATIEEKPFDEVCEDA